MSLSDFLKNLIIDAWYKVFVYLGSVLIIVSLRYQTYGLTSKQVIMLGFSLLFIGLGEWKNHKVLSEIKPANAYTGPAALLKYSIRKPDFGGRLFLFIGIIIGIIFLYSLFSNFFG